MDGLLGKASEDCCSFLENFTESQKLGTRSKGRSGRKGQKRGRFKIKISRNLLRKEFYDITELNSRF